MSPALGLLAGLLLGTTDLSQVHLLSQADAPVAHWARLLPDAQAPGRRSLSLLEDGGAPATVSAEPFPEWVGRAYPTLRGVTAGALLLTGGLGTLVAINQGTLLTNGRCDEEGGGGSPPPIFGTYGCESLSIVHGISGVLSLTLYTATIVLGLFEGEPPLGHGNGHGRLHRILSYVALVGIALQPVLGLVSAYPDILGISSASQDKFGEVVRTAHVGLGYVTIAAYLTTIIIEF